MAFERAEFQLAIFLQPKSIGPDFLALLVTLSHFGHNSFFPLHLCMYLQNKTKTTPTEAMNQTFSQNLGVSPDDSICASVAARHLISQLTRFWGAHLRNSTSSI